MLDKTSLTRPTKVDQSGFALVTTLLMLAVLSSLLAAYFLVSRFELASMKASKDITAGFFAAEGGLNLRAETIRTTFVGYNTPSGTSPNPLDACEGSNIGSGDFICTTYAIGGRTIPTYVIDHQNGGDPEMIKIPQGELYQNLNAQEYRYTAHSEALGVDDKTEAILELRFKSRLVPLFQFAAFYNKDLEILPGPDMDLSGPVHTNGDLYLNANSSLDINGQITTAGRLYRGRKNDSTCMSTPVRIPDPTNLLPLYPSCPSRRLTTDSDLAAYHGMIQHQVQAVTVPAPEVIDPQPGRLYWDKADLRLVLRLDNSHNPVTSVPIPTGIEVRNADNSVDSAASATLAACTGLVRKNVPAGNNTLSATGTTNAFYNNREAKTIRMLDVDLRATLNCLHNSNWFGTGKQLNDETEGGLVFYFTVAGPDSTTSASRYGIRITNGAQIASTVAGAPAIKGLTIVSEQALYVQGNFNSVNKIPAAALVDSFNALSNNWFNSSNNTFRDSTSTQSVTNRNATDTTMNLAILAGTDSTGGIEGSGGQSIGIYNGGLENYPRFHENWSGRTLTYRGSFVSLNTPRHVNGAWFYGNPQYQAPNRNWDYDTSFNNAANLPPITPRFVYLRQELFLRDFEQ